MLTYTDSDDKISPNFIGTPPHPAYLCDEGIITYLFYTDGDESDAQ